MDRINTSDYKILIVDDVEANVLLVNAILKSSSYQTIAAFNGENAIEIANKELPDIILLDIMMHGLNGYQVAEALRSNPLTQDIPIIFLSALNDVDDIVKGFRSGANDYIDKPFKPNILKSRVYNQVRILHQKKLIIENKKRLEATIKERDHMYSILAHDLRSPMASIKMILNALTLDEKKKLMSEDTFYMLQLANEVTEETFMLLDNLLKWIKTQHKGLTIVPRDINLISDIEGVIQVLSPIVALKNISITLDAPKSLAVYADTDMIQTVLRNLISNAAKFSNSGDNINIKITTNDKFAIVSVIDHGIGIKDEYQEKILDDSNSTAPATGTNNEVGMGLGLKLCRDISKKNGGELWFSSQLGEGSTFNFSIPRHSN